MSSPSTGIGRIAQGDQSRRDGRDEKAVDPIEQAAMAGNEVAHVLGAESPLHRAFAQIADLAAAAMAMLANARRQPDVPFSTSGESIADREPA